MKTYLILGASSAIAKETAHLFRQNQSKVIGISRQDIQNPYDEFYIIQSYTPEYLPDIQQAIDGLIYFPGSIQLKPFHRLSKQDIELDFQINAMGAIYTLQKYLPNLKLVHQASVVLISTVAVQTGMPFHASIAMTKGALEGLTKSLAAELAPQIRVNAIAPSLTQTPLSAKFWDTPEKQDSAQKRNPLKKIGSPKEVAEAVRFLVEDSSSWITGQILSVDGGMGSLRLL